MMKNKNILILIPARMGSSRFPGKPMAKIFDKPMIGHVYERVSKSDIVSKTVVATCDEEIVTYINSIGGEAVMTSSKHERASDRCAEALLKLEEKDNTNYDIVVMVQGDEPMTHPEMIAEAVNPMIENPEIKVVNLVSEINDDQEFEDRNCIKVVCDLELNALYFSREPIPTQAKNKEIPRLKQVCIIPFQRDFLLEYTNMPPTPLEVVESVDMMRILEHGIKVKMAKTKYQTQAVDTPGDLERVSKMMRLLTEH
jgi:3-deoxy-manno-octulosonate cytidylyltransferase (CMP-KDO synthetase)